MTEFDNTTNSSFKKCSKCKQVFPATNDYFGNNRSRYDGFQDRCKPCRKQAAHEWNVANRDVARERTRRYRAKNGNRVKANRVKYRAANMDKERSNIRAWRAANPERRDEQVKKQYWSNPEAYRKRSRVYSATHRAEVNAGFRRRYATNPQSFKVSAYKRRAKSADLPHKFSNKDWENAVDYFANRCAYCNDIAKLAQDHWIPVSDPRPNNPGTVVENILPACKPCNSSKHKRNPTEWLDCKFGEHKAKQILARIEQFFEWVKVNRDH